MNKKIIFLMGFLLVAGWSVGGLCMGEQPGQSAGPAMIAAEPAALNPCDPEAPQGWPQKYTGIIKNETGVEVSVHSGNSDATLIIPAHGWIEYDAWVRHFDLTAYFEGKPYYCLNINANPKAYPFMCQKYDFMAEIVKPEGRQSYPGSYPGKKLKRRVRKERALG